MWAPGRDGNLGVAGDPRSGRTTTLRTIALGLARLDPGDLHLHVIEGDPGSLSDLADLPHTGTVVSTADPDLVRAAVQRLVQVLATGTGSTGPVTVVVIDGWEQVEECLATSVGPSSDTLLGLLRDGPGRGLRFVVAGGRALLSGRLTAVLERRILLPVSDPVTRSLAGLTASATTGPAVPGRGFELPSATELQVAHGGVTPSEPDQRAAVADAARRARASADPARAARPWRVRSLPDRVGPGDLRRRPGLLAVGVGGDDARTVGFDLTTGARALLVTGRRRTGRSTTLATLTLELLRAGRAVAVLATSRSPLLGLGPGEGLTVLTPSEIDHFVTLRRSRPDLAVVVDDAETVEGGPIEGALLEVARRLDAEAGVLVVGADTSRPGAAFRGLVAETVRSRSGIVLCPTAPVDGELLGVRIDVPPRRRPGHGVLVTDGECLPLQVAVPDLRDADPAPGQVSPS